MVDSESRNQEEELGMIHHEVPLPMRLRKFVLCSRPCVAISCIVAFLSFWMYAKVNNSSCYSKMSPAHFNAGRNIGVDYCNTHSADTLRNADLIARLAPQLNKEESIRFMVIGNFGRDGFCCQNDVALEMERAARSISAKFVINTGNAFFPSGIVTPDEEQVKTSWLDVYNGPTLSSLDWISALGENEHEGSVSVLLKLPQTQPRFVIDANYYSRRIESKTFTLQIIVLDTLQLILSKSKQSDEQLVWLAEQLQPVNSSIARIVVGFHAPYSDATLKDFLVPVLEEGKAMAYYSGRERSVQWFRGAGRVDYFVSGAGAEVLANENPFANPNYVLSEQGFLACSLTRRNNRTLALKTALVNKRGEVGIVAESA